MDYETAKEELRDVWQTLQDTKWKCDTDTKWSLEEAQARVGRVLEEAFGR